SIAFAGALAAVPLGWLIARTLERLREWRERPRPKAQDAALAGLALILAGAGALWLAPPASAGKLANHAPAVRSSSCALRAHVTRLDRFAPATIFAPLDIGPSLIERT